VKKAMASMATHLIELGHLVDMVSHGIESLGDGCTHRVDHTDSSSAQTLCEGFLRAMNLSNLHSSQIRVVLDGVRVAPHLYTVSRKHKVMHPDVVDRAVLNSFIQKGATVMMDDCQISVPSVRALCGGITERTGIPTSGTVFASPGMSPGFGLHQDAEAVAIVQLAGTKNWKLFNQVDSPKSSMLTEQNAGECVAEVSLTQGDILFMNVGVPHKTECISDESSVHLTLGFYPVTITEALGAVLQLAENPEAAPARFSDLPNELRDSLSWITGRPQPEVADIYQQAVSRSQIALAGDPVEFRLKGPELPTGAKYRSRGVIDEPTARVALLQLGRGADIGVTKCISELSTRAEFTYRDLQAAVGGSLIAQEILHGLLRTRLIVQIDAGS
jgi:hypothetical protein